MSEGTDRIDALIAKVREDRSTIAALIELKLSEIDKMRRSYAGYGDRIDALLSDRLDVQRAEIAAEIQAEAEALATVPSGPSSPGAVDLLDTSVLRVCICPPDPGKPGFVIPRAGCPVHRPVR